MWVGACVHACVRACERACVRACVHACMHACVHECVCVCFCVCICVCAFVCVYTHIHGNIHVHIYIHVYIYTDAHAYMRTFNTHVQGNVARVLVRYLNTSSGAFEGFKTIVQQIAQGQSVAQVQSSLGVTCAERWGAGVETHFQEIS